MSIQNILTHSIYRLKEEWIINIFKNEVVQFRCCPGETDSLLISFQSGCHNLDLIPTESGPLQM